MSYSLNEIEAVVKRATYATGYSWGIAEETAKATRWLCLFGIDGCEVVSSVLNLQFAKNLSDHSPLVARHKWRGESTLCPLITGATISDFSSQLLKAPIVIQDVAIPKMILPFVSFASKGVDRILTLQLINNSSFEFTTNGENIELSGEVPTTSTDFEIRVGGEILRPVNKVSRVRPSTDCLANLNELANLTYAPVTAESRELGAGSNTEDND